MSSENSTPAQEDDEGDPPPPKSDSKNPMADNLFDRVHAQMRALAQEQMNAERSEHTLSDAALVHEAYVRLQAARTLSRRVSRWSSLG